MAVKGERSSEDNNETLFVSGVIMKACKLNWLIVSGTCITVLGASLSTMA
jgi:hypothetical protein